MSLPTSANITGADELYLQGLEGRAVLQLRRPTPALRLGNPLATFRGPRPCAGAAMVWASAAASEALALIIVGNCRDRPGCFPGVLSREDGALIRGLGLWPRPLFFSVLTVEDVCTWRSIVDLAI